MTPDFQRIAGLVELPDDRARAQARRSVGSRYGRLGDHAVWLAGVQGKWPLDPLRRVRIVVLAGDRGTASAESEARALVEGRGVTAVVAELAGATVRVVDVSLDNDAGLPPQTSRHKVRRGGGRVGAEPVCTVEEAERGFEAGMAVADEEIDAGADLLVLADVGGGAATSAATLASVLADVEVAQAVPHPAGSDDADWMREVAAVRDAARRGRPLLGDQMALLAEVGGADLAAATGFLLQAAGRRTPVVLDGLVSAVGALLAHRVAYRAAHWWLAGHVTADRAHEAALDRLNLTPVATLGLSGGGGVGAVLAVPVLHAAVALVPEG